MVVAAGVLTLVAACGGEGADRRPGAQVAAPLGTSVVAPPPTGTRPGHDPVGPGDLGIGVDAAGRPFDVPGAAALGAEVVHEQVGTMVVEDGELRIMDGSALQVDPVFFADEAVSVRLDGEAVEVTVLSVARRDGSPGTVGVRLDVAGDRDVVRWRPFEPAYGTDGGVGGITTPAILDGAGASGPHGFVPDDIYRDRYYLGAHARPPDPDVFIFGNGVGDGGFPLSVGVDDHGDPVAVLLPSMNHPWRLVVPDGQPPPDVTRREDELLACLTGERPLNRDGACPDGAAEP